MLMCSAPWYSKTRRRSLMLGDDREVGDEDADAHEALDQPEDEARRRASALKQPGEEQRRQEEQADGEGEGDDEGDADLLAR